MQGLGEYEGGVCTCGFHKSLTSNLANVFTFGETICNVCAGTERYLRVQHDGDTKSLAAMGETPPPDRRWPADGRKTHARMLTPDEVEQARARAAEKQAARTSPRSS